MLLVTMNLLRTPDLSWWAEECMLCLNGVIKREGPLSKEDVIKKVSKERYFKNNTILVNLVNPKYFKKNKSGLYTLA